MKSWSITRFEWILLAVCAAIWVIVLSLLPPSLGGTDVYLFRDAASNMVAGRGFATASFERSTTFSPVFYSSYTPGTLWAFAGAAKFLGTGTLAARIYPRFLALIVDLVVLFAGLRFLGVGWRRWAFLALVGLLLPFSFLGSLGERPETVSFLVLVLLALVMRQAPKIAAAALAGLLGGAAFLCEPFAGVLAVLLIGGWLFFAGSLHDGGFRWASFATRSVAAAVLLALPVAITAGAFYHRDPHSLQRFWKQATVAGIDRQASYSMGDSNGQAASAAGASTRPGKLQKYKEALAFHRVLGPIHLFELAGYGAVALAWAVLLASARGPWQGRAALGLAGFACFVFPVAVFPLQSNYTALTRLLFPLLLAANWASIRGSLRRTAVIPLLLVVNAIAVLPESGISVLMGWEDRASYALALRQVETLREHLAAHPLGGRVALVPDTHYYLYKETVGNIYNPNYLSSKEDPSQIGAVVNCYAAKRDFDPGTLPLPPFVVGQNWQRISTAQDSVAVSLLGHKLMSRNWGMGCDIYVRPSS